MARYIDADNFRKTMIKRFGCIPCLTDYSEASRYDMPIDDALKLAPTADVAPKSEVDDLKRYIILNEDIAIKCKRENGEQNEEYWKGKISAFKQIRAYIDFELKKKKEGIVKPYDSCEYFEKWRK